MTEIEQTLLSAAHEIRQLRRENEILSAKVGMIELFDRVLSTQPFHHTIGMSEDIAWRIDRVLDGMRSPPVEDSGP